MDNRIEFLGVNQLIDLEATAVTREDGNLHTGFDITGASYNATNRNQLAYILGLHVSHLHDRLLAEFSGDKHRLIVALKFCRDSCHRIGVCSRILSRDQTLLQLDIAGHLEVKSSLLHDNIKAGLVLLSEIQTGLGHMRIDHFMEHFDISCSIANNSVYKALVSICTEETTLTISD